MVRRCPLAGWIGMRSELWLYVRRSAKSCVVQREQVFYNRTWRCLGIDRIEIPLFFRRGVQLVGVSLD